MAQQCDTEGPDAIWVRACNFESSGNQSILEGLTILAGPPSDINLKNGERAIYCDDSDPTISKCIIKGNDDAYSDLTGLFCYNSEAVISDCTFNGLDDVVQAIWISGDDSDVEIVNCNIVNSDGYGINVTNFDVDLMVKGCTLSGTGGEGIYFLSTGELTITDNTTISGYEHGIHHRGGGVGIITMTGCTITNNGVGSSQGGGIFLDESYKALITDCDLTGNTTGSFGGGAAYIRRCDYVNFKNCTISNNTTSGPGGGIHIYDTQYGPIEFIDCVISDNTATLGGGGINCESSHGLRLENCKIEGNLVLGSNYNGGGIDSSGIAIDVNNCLITGNRTLDGSGGGIYDYKTSGNITISNCTIGKNCAADDGGGIYLGGNPNRDRYVTNCIFWGNMDTYVAGPPEQWTIDEEAQIRKGNLTPAVTYNCIQELVTDGDFDDETNIGTDPDFVEAGTWVAADNNLAFDGTNDYVEVLDPADGSLDFGTGNFTISLWFKTTDTDGELVDKSGGNQGRSLGYSVFIGTTGSVGDGEIAWRLADGTNRDWIKTNNTYNDGDLHHLAVVRAGSGSTNLNIYVDGSDVPTTSLVNDEAGDISNSYDLSMGAKYDAGDTNTWENFLAGIIDNVMIFERVLTPTEIGNLNTYGPDTLINDPDLVSYWEFDEGVGSTTADSVGGNDGTIYGASWTPGSQQPSESDAVWWPGDYHLESTSLCIDAGNNSAAIMFTDETTAEGTPKTIIVGDASKYSVGEEIEYNPSGTVGTLRTVTDIDTSTDTVTFGPALSDDSEDEITIKNYGFGDIDGENRIMDGDDNGTLDVDMGSDEFGPFAISHWMFDKGVGTIAYDSTGTNNNGNIYGPTWTTGKVNNALYFDVSNDYVRVSDDSSLDISDEITITMWLYQESQSTGGGCGVTKEGTYKFGPESTPKYVFRMNTTGGTWSNQFLKSDSATKLDEWTHIAATYDSAATTSRIYINGELDIESATAITGTIETNAADLWIGRGANPYFNGIIDEVVIYDQALPAELIFQVYQDGL
jgi:hypothetical protein